MALIRPRIETKVVLVNPRIVMPLTDRKRSSNCGVTFGGSSSNFEIMEMEISNSEIDAVAPPVPSCKVRSCPSNSRRVVSNCKEATPLPMTSPGVAKNAAKRMELN